jgi:stringent starvation protein B
LDSSERVCYFYSMETLSKKKYDFLLHLLETGDCLDARLPEVDVPENQKGNSSLSLIFNLNFRRPFTVNENAISATLAFSGRPHECLIPLEAVWAIYDPDMKNGQVWEESIPTDMNLADHMMGGTPEKLESKLKSIKTSSKQAPPSGTKSKRDRSHLRVIK